MHSRRNYSWTYVGVRYPHILCLAAVVAATYMRIAEKSSRRRSFRVCFMAVTEKALLAEMAAAAGNIERHHYHITYLQLCNFGADLHYFTDKFMAEGHTYPGVGHI